MLNFPELSINILVTERIKEVNGRFVVIAIELVCRIHDIELPGEERGPFVNG
jgi:hypothetical protein